VAKVLKEFAKAHESLIIKGGLLDDKRLTVEEISALAEIAPREVLLAQLAGAMAAPMQQFAALLNALPQNMAYALQALLEQRGGAPVAATDDEADSVPVAEETDVADSSTEEQAADETDSAPVAEETDVADSSTEEQAADEGTDTVGATVSQDDNEEEEE